MNLTGLLDRSRQSLSEFWTERDARERATLTAGAMALALGITYLLLIDPALNGRKNVSNALPHLRQQVAQMQALSKEAAALSGTPTPAVAPISREIIQAALARNGLHPQNLLLTGDHAKVQLSSASFASMLAWLDEMQKTAMLSVVDANIVALNKADLVDVTLTLRQARNE